MAGLKEAVIVSTARTPMAKYRGDLAALPVPELGATVIRGILEKTGIPPEAIDDVVFGNLMGSDWGNPARQCVLQAGLPISVPGITLDRQCSSSLNAVGLAANMIQCGAVDVVLTGGVESYSQQPFYLKRPGTAYPNALEFTDYKSSIPGGPGDHTPMIITAENLAEVYQISREACDAFALRSHQNAARAWAEGYFDEQVIPVEVKKGRGETVEVKKGRGETVEVRTDATVRPDASLEALAKLAPVMKKDGVVTAGNSSPMNDGATAVLVMSREKAEAFGLPVLAVVKEYAAAGCEPTIMGIGPVYSTRRLMSRFGYTLEDFDLIELNEAFAAQSIACIRELGLDEDKVNVEGGAIAIGHPTGASGGMLVARLVYALRRRGLKRGLVTFCCGGGQGFSLVLENPEA